MTASILRLFEGVSTWSELETRIASLSTEQERGEAFEVFCHAFFVLDPVFQFQKVYRQNEIPPSIRERLGHPNVKDLGIDGLGVSLDDKLFAYQAKFRTDRKATPTLRELSTFFTMSDKADWRIVITNASRLPSSIDDRVRQGRVLSDRLDRLEPEFFDRLRTYLEQQRVVPPSLSTPYKTQREAIDKALEHFKTSSRGQLILPCGTGKTLTAMWIAERFARNLIVVMVPSLALMSNTLREWANNTSITPFRYLCLCSDTTVDLGDDAPIEHLCEIDVPVTTDAGIVSDYLRRQTRTPSVLFCTYQSSKVLSEAVKEAGITFDMGIFDEAHRTTGTQVGVWNMALDDAKVPIEKRLFMTATPRIYAPHIAKKAKEADVLICSMDDEAIFGKPFYEMTFGRAIEENLITDYKVVVICVTDSEVKELIEHNSRVITDGLHEWDAKALAKRIALVKGMANFGLKKVFTFHGKVQGAKAFTDTTSPYSVMQVAEMMAPETTLPSEVKCFHVNGTMPSGVRDGLMKEFRDSDIAIMSNARCLTEGVNVPAVDTVAFIDPKRSLIDIVQATGRAMRKADWKDRAFVFIPVIVEENADTETIIQSSDFDTLWKVLQAMLEQDEHLRNVISQLRIMQGKGEADTDAWRTAMREYAEKVEFYNLPKVVDRARFLRELHAKAIEVIGRSWDFWYGLTVQYRDCFGNANTPRWYVAPNGFKLGSWQNEQKTNHRRGKLSPDRLKKLEEIGFVWDKFEEAWEQGFQETLIHKERVGTPNALGSYVTTDGFRLGSWQQSKKNAFKHGKLSPDRFKKLDEIGFVWDKFDEEWERGFQETLKYREQFGTSNAPHKYVTPDGFRLGSWQNGQRRVWKMGGLSSERFKKLKEIEFKWDKYEDLWEKGFQETLKYREQFGTPNALQKYVTPDGFRLGNWQSSQMLIYKKGDLSPDRLKKLKEIGFVWDKFDERWEKGFQETLKYRDKFGTANALSSHITPDGFRLGSWQGTQRKTYKQGTVPPERVKRLQEIGFWWKRTAAGRKYKKMNEREQDAPREATP